MEEIKIGGQSLPTHMVKMWKDTGIPHDKAVRKALDRMEWRNSIVGQGQEAIRISNKAIREIEQKLKGRVGEMVLAPELRSSTLHMTTQDISNMEGCKGIILNRLVERKEMGGTDSQQTKETKTMAAAHGKVLILIDTKKARGAKEAATIIVKKSAILQNPLITGAPQNKRKDKYTYHYCTGRQSKEKK